MMCCDGRLQSDVEVRLKRHHGKEKKRDWKHHKLAWFITAQKRKAPQRSIAGANYRASVTPVKWDVCTELKDPPSHSLFTLLPSDDAHRRIRCRTARLQSSFCPRAAARSTNTLSQLLQHIKDDIKETKCLHSTSAFISGDEMVTQ